MAEINIDLSCSFSTGASQTCWDLTKVFYGKLTFISNY